MLVVVLGQKQEKELECSFINLTFWHKVCVFPALKIQCSSSAFYLLEEIGGYVLECRGTLQVKVSRRVPPAHDCHTLGTLGAAQWHSVSLRLLQGKGDMVTYWLEGKKTLVSKNASPDAKTTKHVTMEVEKEELYSSLPGFLNDDLLLDLAWWSSITSHDLTKR